MPEIFKKDELIFDKNSVKTKFKKLLNLSRGVTPLFSKKDEHCWPSSDIL